MNLQIKPFQKDRNGKKQFRYFNICAIFLFIFWVAQNQNKDIKEEQEIHKDKRQKTRSPKKLWIYAQIIFRPSNFQKISSTHSPSDKFEGGRNRNKKTTKKKAERSKLKKLYHV